MKTDQSFAVNLIAGGGAGATESLICHPLDTIKTRMQLVQAVNKKAGLFGTARNIVVNEGGLALYKGLPVVVLGITPKMAIRFSSFGLYKELLADPSGQVSVKSTFLAGTLAGITEALCVVTPVEVIKIRMQAQRHSMSDPGNRKYKSVAQTAFLVSREEGVMALYSGGTATAIRQATNQAVNFTAYQEFKKILTAIKGVEQTGLHAYEHLLLGGLSGILGPIANSPIDVVKTRLQKQSTRKGMAPEYTGMIDCAKKMLNREGLFAFYKGLTPRLLRIGPGQAITFMTYEFITSRIHSFDLFGAP